MGIKFILGRAGTGKSHLVLSEISEKLQTTGEHKLVLLVPEQFTLQAERDLIGKQQLKGIMRAEVLSFTRLAHRIFNEVGGLTKVHINDLGKNMILRKILNECEKDLTIYKKTSRQEGFARKLNELICQFKQYDIHPYDLKAEADKIKETSILKMKLADIALIFERFNKFLESRYIDAEDYINLLIENVEKAEFLEGAEIWIDGFYSFTPQTLRIIEKLMLKANQVNITLCMELNSQERNGDLFKSTQSTYLKLKKLAAKHGIEETIINLDVDKINPVRKADEIIHIESELYAYPYQQYNGEVESIEIFAGANLYSEVENAAAQIVALVRDHQYRWKDIAIVSAAMDSYSMIFKRVFQEYGIPYFMDEKRSIMNNPIVELIIAVLETISKNYQYKDMFRYLKTGFAHLTRDECEILENYILKYGIQGNQWMKNFTKSDNEDLELLNQLREKAISPLRAFEGKAGRKGKIADTTKALFELLQEFQLEKKLDLWIEELRKMRLLEHVNENTQIWNTVMEIFDQLTEILGENQVSLKEYSAILESGFSACEIGVIPSTIDQVLIGNFERSRSHDIRALFVIGVNDGIIPSGREEEGILLDHEKTLLGERGFVLGNDGETELLLEKLTIYSVFAKPKEYLWVSYAMADQEGRAMRPSILVDRLKKLFKNIEIKSDVVNTKDRQLHLVATDSSTFKYLVENIRQNIDGKPIENFWWDVYHWYYQNSQWDEKRELVIQGFFHQNQVDYLCKEKIKELYDLPVQASISRLERFSNCPFSHFVAYGLRPREREEYQLTNPDVGKLFHDSLEQFAKHIKDKEVTWNDIDKEQCDLLVEKIMDEMIPQFANGILLSTYRYRYLAKRLKRISKRAIWTLTNHIKRGEFIPEGHEICFGIGKEIPPIIVELDSGEQIYLEGRIDRVDILESDEGGYIKVIDYKSSNKDFSLSDVYYGLQLQLLVYIDAMISMKKHLYKDKVFPAGVFYFKVDDPMIKTNEKALDIVEKEINKKLKMRGLALKDVKIIKAMDREIDRYSDILPVALSKQDEIMKNSSAVTMEEFNDLMLHVKNIIKEISKEMMKGYIKIEPCKSRQRTSCIYCSYQAICQFDSTLEGNKYKVLQNLKAEEVLERIKSRKEGKGDDEVDTGAEGSN